MKNKNRLAGVHPDLVKIINYVNTHYTGAFTIIEGARSAERQSVNVALGRSRTSRSRHVKANNKSGYACAVDMAPLLPDGSIPWKQWDAFEQLNKYMMAAAKALKIALEWGGHWKTLKDGDHWQLPWALYP